MYPAIFFVCLRLPTKNSTQSHLELARRLFCIQASPEAVAMGEQLLNVSGTQFARASAVGAQPSSGDWKVAPELLSGPSLAAATAEVALELFVSGQSSAISMKLGLTATELAKLDASSLEVSWTGGSQSVANDWIGNMPGYIACLKVFAHCQCESSLPL